MADQVLMSSLGPALDVAAAASPAPQQPPQTAQQATAPPQQQQQLLQQDAARSLALLPLTAFPAPGSIAQIVGQQQPAATARAAQQQQQRAAARGRARSLQGRAELADSPDAPQQQGPTGASPVFTYLRDLTPTSGAEVSGQIVSTGPASFTQAYVTDIMRGRGYALPGASAGSATQQQQQMSQPMATSMAPVPLVRQISQSSAPAAAAGDVSEPIMEDDEDDEDSPPSSAVGGGQMVPAAPPGVEQHPGVDGTAGALVEPAAAAAGTVGGIIASGQRYVDITEYLTMPQSEAARKLSIPTSTLSKRWKEAVRGRKWPYRTVAKCDKEIMTLLHNIPQGTSAHQLPEDVEASLAILMRKRQEELKPVIIRLS